MVRATVIGAIDHRGVGDQRRGGVGRSPAPHHPRTAPCHARPRARILVRRPPRGGVKVKRIRAIYERWLDFRERLPEVWAVLRDTSVPPSSRFTRAWRIVDRHLLDRPEWLSSRTESLRDIRFRRQRAERVSTGEKFHRFLHWFHTIERSSWLGGSVFAITVGISLAIGKFLGEADA